MSNYNFSSDWFSNNIPEWYHLLNHLRNIPDLNFLEIGSYEGRSAVWLLENILTNKSSTITCIDTFDGSHEHHENQEWAKLLPTLYDRFQHNVSYFPGQVIPKRGPSSKILKELATENKLYDFIYVDGDHKSCSTLEDAILAFPLLRVGGLMFFDDYECNENNNNLIYGRLGIDAFINTYRNKIEIVSVGYQIKIKKISE